MDASWKKDILKSNMTFRTDVLLPNVVKRLAKNELLPRKLASRVKCTSFPSPFPFILANKQRKRLASRNKMAALAAAAVLVK
jgi:hypothetical protein